jgi:hypothetical protein
MNNPVTHLKHVNHKMFAEDENNNISEGAAFIPDQPDPLGIAVTEAVRKGPFTLAFRDLITCVRMFALFPGVIFPLWTSNPQDEFYFGWGPNLLGLFLLSLASIFEVILLIACVPMFIFLPGPVSVIIFFAGQLAIHLICYPMQGPAKLWSKTPTDPETIKKYERVKGERWFFLNGCCVSGHNVQQNADVLAETFGRPIFAVHNRTYGVIGDLFECILQRSFNLFTEETRVCYEYVKAYCADPEVKKVVLIAHSQGCIMASQILDQLYVDLPAEAVSKLEVSIIAFLFAQTKMTPTRSIHLATQPPISTIHFVRSPRRPLQSTQQICPQSPTETQMSSLLQTKKLCRPLSSMPMDKLLSSLRCFLNA